MNISMCLRNYNSRISKKIYLKFRHLLHNPPPLTNLPMQLFDPPLECACLHLNSGPLLCLCPIDQLNLCLLNSLSTKKYDEQ